MTPYYQDSLTTIYHGDCRDMMAAMDQSSIDLTVTSPPYNCRKAYGLYKDEISWGEYYELAKQWLAGIYRVTRPGGTVGVVVPGVIRWQAEHKYRESWSDFDKNYRFKRDGVTSFGKGRIEPLGFRIMDMMSQCDPHLREPIIWVKGEKAINGKYKMGCDSDPMCRPAHEMILLGSKGRWFHRGGTGRRGKDAMPWMDECKDVWFIDPDNSREHPAPFPGKIPVQLIRLFIHAKDGVIFDPFMGKGTTLVAAKLAGFKSIGIDMEEKFCELACKKLSAISI